MIEPDARSRTERARDCWIEDGRAVGDECREAADRTSSSAWKLGDWSNAHERSYGDLRLAVEEGGIGVAYDYVKLCGHVARRIEPERRRPALTFGHHQAVAGLDEETADRLLAEAELKNWSRDEMRLAVREASPEAAQRRRADKLQAEVDRLKQQLDAPDPGEAATTVGDTLRTVEAEAKEVLRSMERLADRLEAPDYTAAKGALHGNAARGADRKVEKIMAELVLGMKAVAKRIDHTMTADAGTVDGYAAHNGATAQAGIDAPEDSYATHNLSHRPNPPPDRAGGGP